MLLSPNKLETSVPRIYQQQMNTLQG